MAMELTKAIETRTSVRQFLPDAISIKDMKEICRLASLAPSVNNFQPWKFIAITNKDLLKKMADAIRNKIHELPENDSKYSTNVKKQVEFFATFFEDAPRRFSMSLRSRGDRLVFPFFQYLSRKADLRVYQCIPSQQSISRHRLQSSLGNHQS